jgi:dTDP-glucose 4,6-dehydratase
LLEADVRHIPELPRNTNWLVHAAASPDTRAHARYPIETMIDIGQATAAVLREAERLSDINMMLNVSSGRVYGPQPLDLDRIPESYAGGPRLGSLFSAYGEAKRYAETLGAAFRDQSRVPVAVVRPFTFIGPYQALSSPWAANTFIRDAVAGREVRVLGDGQTVRSFMYASDMAYWVLRILTGAETGSHYNLGNPEAVTLAQLARSVASQFEPAPDIRFSVGPSGAHRQSRLVPDVTLAERDFGLQITTPLQVALEKTVRWYRSETDGS